MQLTHFKGESKGRFRCLIACGFVPAIAMPLLAIRVDQQERASALSLMRNLCEYEVAQFQLRPTHIDNGCRLFSGGSPNLAADSGIHAAGVQRKVKKGGRAGGSI